MDNYENNNQFPWDYEPTNNPIPEPPKKSKEWTAGKIIAITLSAALLGGLFGAGSSILINRLSDRNEMQPPAQSSQMLEGSRQHTVIQINQIDTGKLMTPAEVYAKNVNSTVGITTSITTNFWGYQTTSAASGSGFIISDDGYIITNHHVIEDSDAITVSLYDGTTYDAQLVGYDESNDLAVLKVDAQNLPPVIMGDSGKINVGDSVIAIGNPLGELTFTLTSGAVSAKDRRITMSNGVTMNLLQTDCAINSGNSGGALFNLYGEVIGITNAKYSSSSNSEASIDNIGFAIPLNEVRSIITSIIEKGYISKPYIGVSVADVSKETQSYGLPQGASVRSITENSPAQAGGLLINDIITHVNGTAITGSNDLVRIVGNSTVGDTLTLNVYRQGKTLELTITVGEQILSALENNGTPQGGQVTPPWGNRN